MYIPFAQLADHSRIWLYQADRSLTEKDIIVIQDVLRDFCERWVAHQQPMHSSFEVLNNRLIVLAADEEKCMGSGCSIDSSVDVMRQLGANLGIDWFKRTEIAFMENDAITSLSLPAFKKQLADGTLSPSDMVFNTLIEQKSQLSKLLIPVQNSWLSRFLPATRV
jgi:hypothetical protein